MKLEQAARQALEALEMYNEHGAILRPLETTNALREALAEQAEQEPVGEVLEGGYEVRLFDRLPEETPLYAAPVRTKDLTDDEIVEALGYDKSYRLKRWVLDDARAVIAADREKNK